MFPKNKVSSKLSAREQELFAQIGIDNLTPFITELKKIHDTKIEKKKIADLVSKNLKQFIKEQKEKENYCTGHDIEKKLKDILVVLSGNNLLKLHAHSVVLDEKSSSKKPVYQNGQIYFNGEEILTYKTRDNGRDIKFKIDKNKVRNVIEAHSL